jgi:hypothetical protein
LLDHVVGKEAWRLFGFHFAKRSISSSSVGQERDRGFGLASIACPMLARCCSVLIWWLFSMVGYRAPYCRNMIHFTLTASDRTMSFLRILAMLAAVWLGLAPLPGASAEKAPTPQIGYSAVQPGTGPVSVYVPGQWGILNLEVTNPLDVPQEFLSTTYFDGQSTLQFGRRLWLPAHSRLWTSQPILLPKLPAEGSDRWNFHSLVFNTTGGTEVATRDVQGQMLRSGVLPARTDAPLTALVDGRDARHPDAERDSPYNLVIGSRVSLQLSPALASFPGDRFMADQAHFSVDDASWKPLQQLILADSCALDDPGGLAAIRRWVYGGGRLWVMLDRVDPRILERILGDEFLCDVVDRIGLTSIRIEPTSPESGSPPVESEYEQPIDLVRVLVSGVDVPFTIHGWPAAFWKTFGSGKVLVTTLAPRGWMRARTAADPELSRAISLLPGAGEARRFVPLPPMAAMTKEFFPQTDLPATYERLLEPGVGEYIGYSIPPRWLIMSLLGVFIAVVAGLEIWLLRRSTFLPLDWLSSALAIGVAGLLLVVGVRNRHAIPMTAAGVEFVEAIPGSDDVRSEGAFALYNPESSPSVIGTTEGGRLIPDLTGLEGTTKRIVWQGLDTWNWENLSLGAGERRGTQARTELLPERFTARGTFGPEGITGQFSAPGVTVPADALIATRRGRIGVDLAADDVFRAPVANLFGHDQYIAAGLLSDEQDRRRIIYSRILPEFFREDQTGRPSLFLWGERRGGGFAFEKDRILLGASLIAIPLALDRPPAGTPVRIPELFLPFRNTKQPDGSPSSPLWDHRRQEWMESTRPGTAWFRFQLPAELLPIDLTGARIVITVSGPVGRVELSALRRPDNNDGNAQASRGEAVSVETWNAPVGTLSAAEIADAGLLQLDGDGGLVLGLSAGEPASPDAAAMPGLPGSRLSAWRIEHLSVEVSGTIAP